MNVSASISVPEYLRNRVAELAASEQRSFSQMWCLLVERSLDGQGQAELRAFTESEGKGAGPSRAAADVDRRAAKSPPAPPAPGISGDLVSSEPVSTPSEVDISALMKMAGRRINKCGHRVPVNEVCFTCDRPFVRRLG